MTRTERERCFSRIKQLVGDKFYDPGFRGKDWKAIAEQHRSNVVGAETLDAFDEAVNSMLKEVGSGALGLLRERSKISSRNAISASFREIDTPADGPRWVFQDVAPGGPSDLAGVKPGDTLIRIGSNDVLPPTRPTFVMGSEVQLMIRHGRTGQTEPVTVAAPKAKHRDNPTAEPNSVLASMSDGVGILKVSLFPGKLGIDFAHQVSAAVDTTLKDAEALVVDMRGNPGGGVGCLRLMSIFTPDRVPVGYSLDRNLAETGYEKDSLPRFNRLPSSNWEVPLLALRYARKKSVVLETEGLGQKRFHGRIAVLVNEHTTCAAEMVALFAEERGLAQIIGMPTPGRLVSHGGFNLGHGFTLAIPTAAYVSWLGTRLDGTGIRPSVEIDWSYSHALDSYDAQVEIAKRAVLNRLSSSASTSWSNSA